MFSHIPDQMNAGSRISGHLKSDGLNVREFFEQWGLYRKIIDCNYMFHREIAEALRELYLNHISCRFKLLDLGCGDSHTAYHSLKDAEITSYTGVDISKTALEIAEKNFSGFNINKVFIEDDLCLILDKLIESYDVIQIGYSMHHLGYHKKKIMLDRCYKRLNESGILILYDICRRTGETRDEYLEDYRKNFEQSWTKLTSTEMKTLNNHIVNYDYPETIDTLVGFGLESGFRKHEIIFRDHPGFHFMMYFYKQKLLRQTQE